MFSLLGNRCAKGSAISHHAPDLENILLIDEAQVCEGFEKAIDSLHALENDYELMEASNSRKIKLPSESTNTTSDEMSKDGENVRGRPDTKICAYQRMGSLTCRGRTSCAFR